MSTLWSRLDKLAWKHLPCTGTALLEDFRTQALSGNLDHSFVCAALNLHEAQQAVLKSLGDIEQSWSALPYCDADRIEFEGSAIGDNDAEDIRWPSGEVMKDVFAEIPAMSLINDIVAEAAGVRSLALREFVGTIGIAAFVMLDRSGPSGDFSDLDIKDILDMNEVKISGFAEVASTVLRTTAENATGTTLTPCQSFAQLVDTLLEHCPEDTQLAIGNTGLSTVSILSDPKADLQLLCRALAMLNRCCIFVAHISGVFC